MENRQPNSLPVELEIADIEKRSRVWLEHSPVCTKIVDLDFNLRFMSQAGIQGLGIDDVNEFYGKPFPFDFYPQATKDELIGKLQKAKETGNKVESEAPVTNLLGEEVWFYSSIVPVKDDRGEIEYFVVVSANTTERKKLEDQLRHAQKMEAVGQLTGGLAHDLNNTLAIISINVGLLSRLVTDTTEASKHSDVIMQSIQRASNLTRKLLDFSRTKAVETRLVSVNEFVQGMESLISNSVTPAIKIKTALTEAVWPVEIDPGDLENAILNLALNARDAMPDGGTLVIETVNKVIDQGYVNRNPGSAVGEFVMVLLTDTGTGMTAETKEKAFEPFFTTKDVGKGTGLGLSMVYGFVQRSGGHVKIYSEPGEGTTVHLFLPRALGLAHNKDPQSLDQDGLPGGDETILVVDDDERLVDAAASLLGILGYRTVTATDGKKALEILRQDLTIDLLFSDVIMPGSMDGYALAFEALNDRPDLKVLLTSGFARERPKYENGDSQIVSDLARTLLHKPYNMAELAGAVRGALNQGDNQ